LKFISYLQQQMGKKKRGGQNKKKPEETKLGQAAAEVTPIEQNKKP